MKLDSKQMHIVSQLFMAAGKAGRPFDLARFAKDAAYASDTVAMLTVFAFEQKNEGLQSLAAITMEVLSDATARAITATPAPAPAPASTPAPPAPDSKLAAPSSLPPQKYVGQLR